MRDHTPADIPSGRTFVGDMEYMTDAKGGLVPVNLIKPQHLLEDEMVRKVMGYSIALSEQVSRFKEHTFDDLGAFEAILLQEYGSTVGGAKGNKTLTSFDGLFKITVQVADNIVFGSELQIAKGLIDECLNEWAAGARDEIRAIVTRAFNTDKAGQINRSEIFMLLRLEGSKTYIRCHRRPSCDASWQAVTIDLAKA